MSTTQKRKRTEELREPMVRKKDYDDLLIEIWDNHKKYYDLLTEVSKLRNDKKIYDKNIRQGVAFLQRGLDAQLDFDNAVLMKI